MSFFGIEFDIQSDFPWIFPIYAQLYTWEDCEFAHQASSKHHIQKH